MKLPSAPAQYDIRDQNETRRAIMAAIDALQREIEDIKRRLVALEP